MELSFLTPVGGLFVLAALAPLLVWRARERRLRQVRSALRLEEPTLRSQRRLLAALVGICALLALAAAQPVVATARKLPERTDAQVFFVIDTSRSMYASAGPGEPSRFERGRSIAVSLRDALPEIPMGIASMTDGVLPHLFPTTDRRVFVETSRDSIDIERPPPSLSQTLATSLEGLRSIPRQNYFAPAAKKRVLIVLSDAESRPLEDPGEFQEAFQKKPAITTIFVRLWDAEERIYLTGLPEVGYEPDPSSGEQLDQIASLIEAQVISESEAGELPAMVSQAVGEGPTMQREHEGRRRALMPWITLLAIFPLGLVLRRRNV
jgi:von Willebrand factor type A domain